MGTRSIKSKLPLLEDTIVVAGEKMRYWVSSNATEMESQCKYVLEKMWATSVKIVRISWLIRLVTQLVSKVRS